MLLDLFAFLLDVDNVYGTVVERRILEVMESGFTTKTAYKLKDTTNNLCRQRHMYSDAQIETMTAELASFNKFWGYDGSQDSPYTISTSFFASAGDQSDNRTWMDAPIAKDPSQSYHFGKIPKLMTMGERIPDKVSIKHREQ